MSTFPAAGPVPMAPSSSWLDLLGPELADRRAWTMVWPVVIGVLQIVAVSVNMYLHLVSGPSMATILLWLVFTALAVVQLTVVQPVVKRLRRDVAAHVGLPPQSASRLMMSRPTLFITSVTRARAALPGSSVPDPR